MFLFLFFNDEGNEFGVSRVLSYGDYVKVFFVNLVECYFVDVFVSKDGGWFECSFYVQVCLVGVIFDWVFCGCSLSIGEVVNCCYNDGSGVFFQYVVFFGFRFVWCVNFVNLNVCCFLLKYVWIVVYDY